MSRLQEESVPAMWRIYQEPLGPEEKEGRGSTYLVYIKIADFDTHAYMLIIHVCFFFDLHFTRPREFSIHCRFVKISRFSQQYIMIIKFDDIAKYRCREIVHRRSMEK